MLCLSCLPVCIIWMISLRFIQQMIVISRHFQWWFPSAVQIIRFVNESIILSFDISSNSILLFFWSYLRHCTGSSNKPDHFRWSVVKLLLITRIFSVIWIYLEITAILWELFVFRGENFWTYWSVWTSWRSCKVFHLIFSGCNACKEFLD